MPKLTILTPTYNRVHTLPRLCESLCNQTNKNFEWLVINDGSTDNTSEFCRAILSQETDFQIRYIEIPNGGKNRALNQGLKLARGRYFMILDSDDLLPTDAVEFILSKTPEIDSNPNFIGLSGKRADLKTGLPIGVIDTDYCEEGYIDCNNLERSQYGLERDMAEVFKTDILRKYEFKVWSDEKFTPEEVVWNQIALDGYKLRWYNKITYMCEYQSDGLTNSTWSLLKNNPMGYAMMFDQRLIIEKDFRAKFNNAIQYGSCCWLAKQFGMLVRSNAPLLTTLLSPISYTVAQRRKKQFRQLI